MDADEWYYYFDFAGAEVKPRLKKDRTSGMYNWDEKAKPIMHGLFALLDNPHVFDIGCNMALYDHEMSKMGAKVTGIDMNLSFANIYKQYVEEYLGEEFEVEIAETDVVKSIPAFANTGVNIVTMFCVIYHLEPHASYVVEQCLRYFPNLKYMVVQGNAPRVKKKNQPLGGHKGITKFLQRHGFKTSVYYKDYQKPIVVGSLG